MRLTFPLFHRNVLLTTALALCILWSGLFLLHYIPVTKKDAVANGLLADMVITFPVAFYFLVIKRFKLNKRVILLVFSCCCAVSWLVLPPHQQQYILQLRKLSFVLELGIIVYALSKIKRIITTYQVLQTRLPDSAYHLQQSLIQVLGKSLAIKMLAAELCVMRYGLLWWKKSKTSAITGHVTYTVHQQTGYTALFGVILFVSVLELTVVHLLLLKYSTVAAYIVSALSAYGMLFIIGDFAAIVKQPVLLTSNQILLRTGMRWRTVTSISNIITAERINDNYEPCTNCFKGGVMKTSVNVLLTFAEPVNINRLYGKTVTTSKIALSIDNADQFIKQLSTGA